MNLFQKQLKGFFGSQKINQLLATLPPKKPYDFKVYLAACVHRQIRVQAALQIYKG